MYRVHANDRLLTLTLVVVRFGPFCSLIPLRIAHHPGVILDVVMTTDCQHDSNLACSSSNSNKHLGGTLSSAGSAGGDMSLGTRYCRLEDYGY